MKRKEWLDRLLSILYPPRCVCCGEVLPAGETLCEACEKRIVRIEAPVCLLCGYSLQDCGRKHPKTAYQEITAPFYYEEAVREGIHRFKFRDRPQSAIFFAREMAKSVRENMPGISFDLIVCVPMLPAKEKKRGYNQSALLARELSALLGVPADCHALCKSIDTPAQHELKGAERKGNVFGVFEVPCPEAVEGKTVLLCDDVKTTGATLDECAKMLKFAGAKDVYCACIAVTRIQDKAKQEPPSL